MQGIVRIFQTDRRGHGFTSMARKHVQRQVVGVMDNRRLDRKLADVIGSNIVGKCDVTLSRAIQPLTSDVLRVLFVVAYFTISQSSTIQIAHVLK